MSEVIVVVLTDGDAVLDVRGITAEELGQLNELAQDVTEGELWWEVMEADGERMFAMPKEKTERGFLER